MTKREILEELKRDELIAAVEHFDLEVADRRKRDRLIDALVPSHKATIDAILGELKRDRLKELCRAFELADGGREKRLIVERLKGARPAAASPGQATLDFAEEPAPKKPRGRAPTRTPRPAPAKDAPNNQMEARLWDAADELRANSKIYEYFLGKFAMSEGQKGGPNLGGIP